MNYDRSYLESLIAGRIEEGPSLEYKSAAAFSRNDKERDAITTHVSAMSNAGGGVIIYGIAEFKAREMRHLPEAIDPIDQRTFSREWVDQRLSLIQPKIAGIKIHPIHVGPEWWDYVYVIEVPQGETAHQATDRKYYRRRNFEVTAMEDYEIREAMNRKTTPKIEIKMRIYDHQDGGSINVRLHNVGRVIAMRYVALLKIPIRPITGMELMHNSTVVENNIAYWEVALGSESTKPIFPDSFLEFDLPYPKHGDKRKAGEAATHIEFTVYADEMPKLVVNKSVKDALVDWS